MRAFKQLSLLIASVAIVFWLFVFCFTGYFNLRTDAKAHLLVATIISNGNEPHLRSFLVNCRAFFCLNKAQYDVRYLIVADDIPRAKAHLPNDVSVTFLSQKSCSFNSTQIPSALSCLAQIVRKTNPDFVVLLSPGVAFRTPVCQEILGEKVAVLSAWFYNETLPTSFRTPKLHGRSYYSGSLISGGGDTFLDLAAFCQSDTISSVAQPETGDHFLELCWNLFLVDHPPSVTLPPQYMYPTPPYDLHLCHMKPTIWLDSQGRRVSPLQITSLPLGYELTNGALLFPHRENAHEVTIGIKAFERPQCLERLLLSLAVHYPTVPIVVVDDSRQPNKQYYVSDNTLLTYVYAGFDTGLAQGRNMMLDYVKTRFFLLLDDDFVVDGNFSIESFLDVLLDSEAKIVGGSVLGEASSFFVGVENRILTVKQHVKPHLTAEDKRALSSFQVKRKGSGMPFTGCYFTEMVDNFFMAETAALKRILWDPYLKLGEHEDFFLRAKRESLPVAFCSTSGFMIINDHGCDDLRHNRLYSIMRARALSVFWPYIFEKYNLTKMKTEAGEYWLECPPKVSKKRDCTINTTQSSMWWLEGSSRSYHEEKVLSGDSTEYRLTIPNRPPVALCLNGYNYIQDDKCNLDILQGNNSFTIEMTVLAPESADGLLLSVYDSDESPVYLLSITDSEGLLFRHGTSSSLLSTRFKRDTWTTVTVTYDGTVIKLYLDGYLEGAIKPKEAITFDTAALRIGSSISWSPPQSSLFVGCVSMLKVWSTAKPQVELMNHDPQTFQSYLQLHWDMNHIRNWTISDQAERCNGHVHGPLILSVINQ